MPGTLGIIDSESFKTDVSGILDSMAAPLLYNADQIVKQFHGDWFACAVIDYGPRFPFLKSASAEKDGVLLIMEGEVFPDAADVPHELAGKSPTIQRAEYCLYLYLKDGPDFAVKLNGVFSITVIDQRNHSVHLYTDRFGHRLLFTAGKSNQFAFASSVRSLLRWRKDIGLRYDERSLAEFVVFERVLGNRTLFSDIKRLLPATHATLTGHKWYYETYYEIHGRRISGNHSSWKDGANMLLDCLRESVRKRTSDESTKGLLLSGGLDSRLVMLACHKPVITASFSNSDDKLSLESRISAKVAQVQGFKHSWLPRDIDYYAQIAEQAAQINEGLSSAFVGCHSIGVHDIMTQAGLQVVMTGDRFDAAFKDFWNGLNLNSQLYKDSPIELDARRMARIIANSPLIRRAEHQDLMMLAFNKEMKNAAVLAKEEAIAALEECCSRKIQNATNDAYEILRPLALAGPFWQGFTAMGVLRGLASHFLERSPFFDNAMLDLALSFPVSWALRGRMVRRAIKLASPKMARISDVNTRLPAGLCPPWDRLAADSREFLLKFGRILSKRSKQVAKLRQPHPGTKVFSSRGWMFSHNAALVQSHRYRLLVEDAIKNAPSVFFNNATLQRLFKDDLNCGTPRMWKLWHMLISLRNFDKKWGPGAPR